MRHLATLDFVSRRLGILLFILLAIVFTFGGSLGLGSTANAAEPVLINTITRTGFSAGSFTGLGVGFHSAAFKFTSDFRYSLSAFEMNYYYGALGWTIRDGLDGAVLGNASTQITGVSGLPRWEFSPPVMLNPGMAYYLQSGGFAGSSLYRMPGNGGHFTLGNNVYGLTDNGSGWITMGGGNANYVSGGGDITFYGELLTKVFIDALLMADPETGSFLHEGAALSKNSVKFEAMASTTLGASVKLQAEVRKSDVPFTGISDGNIYESIFTSSPGYLAVVIPSLLNGEYHARFRTVDDLGNASDWREFGAPGNIDFTINFVSNTASALINVFNPSSGSRGSFTGLGYSVGAAACSFTPDKDYTLTRFEMEYYDNGLSWNIRSGLGGEIIATSSQTIPVSSIHKKWEFFGGVNLAAGTTYYLQTAGGFNSAGLLRLSGSGTTWTPGGVVYGRSDYNMLWNTFGNPIEPQNFLVGAGNGATVDFYGFSTSAVAKNPVIIVPGIMGSRLNRVSDGEEVWPDMGSMLPPGPDAYLNEIKLDKNSSDTGLILPAGLVDRELSIFTIYGNLIDLFLNNHYASGTDLFQVPYDWRLDLRDEVDKLSAIIQKALRNSPTGKVDIITHSMGGLLVKEYLNRIATSTDFVDKLVLLGSPQLGAPKAFKALNYGDNMGFELGSIDILNPLRVKEITQNMPGAYELLPSEQYINEIDGYVWDFRSGKPAHLLTYGETNDLMFENPVDSRNTTTLDIAEQFHANLDNVPIKATNIYNVVGCHNTDTVGKFFLYDDDKVDITPVDGDGTVTLASALNLSDGYRQNYFVRYDKTGVDHMGLVTNAEILSLIYNIIANHPLTELPGGVSDTKSYCDLVLSDAVNETTIVSTHSPVALHVYDTESRHTGPLSNGDFEFGIPGSSYEKIGENSFAFLPASSTYRFVMDGLDKGSFDMKIKTYAGATIQSLITYLAIPLASNSTNAEVDFTGAPSPLLLDNNGDGTFDSQISPTAVLSSTLSTDVTPPSIKIITPKNGDYTSSESLPITVSIFDNESGIAIQEWHLNNTLLSTSTLDLFYLPLGALTLTFHAVDNAGNPANTSTNFRVIATPSSTISDIERAYTLGWVVNKSVKNQLITQLKSAIRLEKRIEKVQERLPDGTKREKLIERIEDKIDRILAKLLLKDLEKLHSKGFLTKEGYAKIKEDIQWMIYN